MKGKLTVLLGAAMLAGWAVPAWAHVTAEDPSVPKDSETEITFSVPVEEHGHAKGMHAMHEGEKPGAEEKGEPAKVYNQEVTIEVPRGFEVLSCDQTVDWKCEAKPANGSPAAGQAPGGTITFTRVTKSGTSMDHLTFTVHTPTHIGTYSFPTTQKLSDGDETEWKGGGETTDTPAPTVKVVDEEPAPGGDAGHDHH
ncbi:MAG: DUF1775 domain-containing protein [Actinobacteria bacterium]|nr:DUF1775 domain-containing protein [Actinomycetota bacterium]